MEWSTWFRSLGANVVDVKVTVKEGTDGYGIT